eukprot:gene4264-biopygen4475
MAAAGASRRRRPGEGDVRAEPPRAPPRLVHPLLLHARHVPLRPVRRHPAHPPRPPPPGEASHPAHLRGAALHERRPRDLQQRGDPRPAADQPEPPPPIERERRAVDGPRRLQAHFDLVALAHRAQEAAQPAAFAGRVL